MTTIPILSKFRHGDFQLERFSRTDTAADFVQKLWRASHLLHLVRPSIDDIELATYSRIILPTAKAVHHQIFGPKRGVEARDGLLAIHRALYETVWDDADAPSIMLPQGTLELFDDALARGLISHVAWSAAVRICYLHYASHSPKMNGERMPRFVEALARADPSGLMTDEERSALAALPDTVTLYRSALTSCVDDAATGISWSPKIEYARWHMKYVGWLAGENRHEEGSWKHEGRTNWLVQAIVPKTAILAHVDREGRELLVDYRKIERSQITVLPAIRPSPSPAAIEAARRYLQTAS